MSFKLICTLALFVLAIGKSHAAQFEIKNNCPFTIWPAAVPVGGGRQLNSGETWWLDVPAGTVGARIWGRTNCNFDGNGNGRCETGDCGNRMSCGAGGAPPATLAEFALNQWNGMDFWDISNVDGFNLPIEFWSNCGRTIRCAGDLVGQCPAELRTPGGCKSACLAFNTNEYCCFNGPQSCGPTNYSRFFKDRCPDAYSYAYDDASSTFTCPGGSNYKVTFCP